MTKKEIVENVSRRTGIKKEAVCAVLEEAIDTTIKAMCNGESVYIRGLFTLSVVKRAKKVTRDIRKGKTIISPSHYVPRSKFAKKLCDKIRELPITDKK